MKSKGLIVFEIRPGSLRIKDGVVVAVELVEKYTIKSEGANPTLPEAAAQRPDIDTIIPVLT